MLYFSLVLISLGILIFLYSILADAKRRRDMPVRPDAAMPPAAPKGAKPASPAAGPARDEGVPNNESVTREERGGRPPLSGHGPGPSHVEPRARRKERAPAAPSLSESDMTAVLYEDSSRVIDYASESGSIDPSLEKYKKIRRLGEGRVSLESEGISFFMGKKMYRYDFHRIRDIKTGDRHMALFLAGSEAVKLFIFDRGGVTASIGDTFREFLRRSS